MLCARVLHLTDPHLFADRNAALRGATTFATLERVLEHYIAAPWRADAIALTGDLTQDESVGAYENIDELLSPLGLPVLVVPGNHDVRSIMRKALSTPLYHYCGSLPFDNWLLAGIDSCVADAAHGEVADAELARLTRVLEDAEAEHVVVCLHHPPVEVGSLWLDEVGLRNRDGFLKHIERLSKVRALLFGHVHQDVERVVHGTTVIGTPSTCRQFLPTSDHFALDAKPPAYRRVELFDDGRVSNELVWVDDRIA